MAPRLPLSALLSQPLVAFTIEFDNEFERQMPHRTTRHGSGEEGRSGPWLASMVMWLKFMRFIPADGISGCELQPLTGLTPKSLAAWLTRLGKWWGYLQVDRAGIVRLTAGGRKAQTIWLPLTGAIERRWEDRFGKDKNDALRNSLSTVAEKLDSSLPDYMPILGYGLFSKTADGAPPVASSHSLGGLLAKVLLAFAVEFERESEVSLRSARTFSASLAMKTRGFEIFRRTRAYRRKQSRCPWAFYKSEAMPLSRPKPRAGSHISSSLQKAVGRATATRP